MPFKGVFDSCIIFDQKKNWYKSTKKSYDNWNTPIALQLAIINQESSFKQFAKPERKKLFGIIPTSRPSTAFGYAQVTNPTWDWYKTKKINFELLISKYNVREEIFIFYFRISWLLIL